MKYQRRIFGGRYGGMGNPNYKQRHETRLETSTRVIRDLEEAPFKFRYHISEDRDGLAKYILIDIRQNQLNY